MLCKKCGSHSTSADFCSVCGCMMESDGNLSQTASYELSGAPKVLGILSLVAGILALVMGVCCCWFYLLHLLLIAIAIAGFVLGIIGMVQAKKQGLKNPMAKLGLIFSCIGLICPLLFWICYIILAVTVAIVGGVTSSGVSA